MYELGSGFVGYLLNKTAREKKRKRRKRIILIIIYLTIFVQCLRHMDYKRTIEAQLLNYENDIRSENVPKMYQAWDFDSRRVIYIEVPVIERARLYLKMRKYYSGYL